MGITVKLGSTVIYSAYGAAPGAAATNLSFGLMVTLQPDNTPGSSVNVYTNPLPGATVVSSVFPPLAPDTVAQPVANIATNGALVITPNLSCSGTTNGNVTLQQMIIWLN
jgi:hypothetical protein